MSQAGQAVLSDGMELLCRQATLQRCELVKTKREKDLESWGQTGLSSPQAHVPSPPGPVAPKAPGQLHSCETQNWVPGPKRTRTRNGYFRARPQLPRNGKGAKKG